MTLVRLMVASVALVAAGAESKWPWSHRGDVRAVVEVPPALAGKEVSVVIEWRRHDAHPEQKKVLVTDHTDRVIDSDSPVVTPHNGVVTFNTSSLLEDSIYFVYWLPYTQSGIGSGMKFAWDGGGGGYESIGSFVAAMGTNSTQTFKLPSPHTGRHFRWQCSKTGIGEQPFVSEVRLVCDDADYAQCYPNATKESHLPVVASSGSQPGGGGAPHDAWMAMDGDLSTLWDASGRDPRAWIDIQFPRRHTISAVELHNYGDKTHDCGAFDLLVPQSAPNSSRDWRKLPTVPESGIVIEARTEFESFKPMELAANSSEVAALLAARGGAPPYLLFAEPRELPVRMQDHIPVHWTDAPTVPSVSASVTRGEYFTWQLAAFVPPGAHRLTNVSLDFNNFGAINVTCFNLGGIDPQGKTFDTAVTVEADRVRSLWLGAQIPASMVVGSAVEGSVVFSAAGVDSATVPVSLTISDSPVQMTEPEPSKMTRLRWLNSDLYTNDYGLVPPYTAMVRDENALDILNRRILVGTSPGSVGMPAQINVTRQASRHGTLPARTIQLLKRPMELELVDNNGRALQLAESEECGPGLPQYTQHGDGLVSWVSSMSCDGLCVVMNMQLSMEGMVSASVAASATGPAIALSDIRIRIAFAKQHGLSWAGLAKRGQSGSEDGGLSLSKGNFSWRWSKKQHSEQLFVGSANAGMKVHLRGNTTEWLSPIERFYDAAMALPDEWGANNGKGGINASVTAEGGVDVLLFTGPQLIDAASSSSSRGVFTLNFDVTALPFKTPNETQHWSLRHFQVGYPSSTLTSVADVAKSGANVINIHQGVSTMINPYIK
jgi:hypothetical protein